MDRHPVANGDCPSFPVKERRADITNMRRGKGETLAEQPEPELLILGIQPALDD
jgi:hypothetical protein